MAESIYHLSVLGTVVIAVVTFRHAWGDGERATFFGLAIVYGFLVEKAAVDHFGMHSYPPESFSLYLWGVPVAIPLAWGVIVYASLMAGRYLGLRRNHLPVFAGLYVLHIDLAIDAIAIRVPFWMWHLPGVWFGVPIVNFVGWYSVAMLYTGFFLRLRTRLESCVLVGLLSLLASFSLLLAIVEVWLRFVAPSALLELLVFGTIVLTSVVYVTRVEIRPGIHLEKFPQETFVSVLLIHLFYLQTMIYSGFYRDSPILLYTSIGMLLVGVALYHPLAWRTTRQVHRAAYPKRLDRLRSLSMARNRK